MIQHRESDSVCLTCGRVFVARIREHSTVLQRQRKRTLVAANAERHGRACERKHKGS